MAGAWPISSCPHYVADYELNVCEEGSRWVGCALGLDIDTGGERAR